MLRLAAARDWKDFSEILSGASVLTDIDKTHRRRESVLEAYRHGFRLGQEWHARRALGQETGD